MTLWIVICLSALLSLLWLLRRDRLSLGLPVAYLYSLLLIHIPGAFAHAIGSDFLVRSDIIEIAMRFTALSSVCFVIGVWLARSASAQLPCIRVADRSRLWIFCLTGGWLLIYGLTPLFRFPSVGAVVEEGGGIWMLGVLLGLRAAFQRRSCKGIVLWVAALMVFPVAMLLLGGFLSYGSAAIIVVCSALTISTKSYWRVLTGIIIFTFLSLSIFVNYFQHRNDIRHQVWGGAPLEARVESAINVVKGFEWFDPNDRAHLIALDQRLNQNYFVGLAVTRIQQGQVRYLYGQSLWQGLLALIPRALWRAKPVFAGSPEIVSKMTGLRLSPTTSFGVGNVMEFQINFGNPGIVVGFFVLGWIIGRLDLKAAIAELQCDFGDLFLSFLCCVALLKPNGSMVELSSGSAAAAVAALVWNFAWERLGRGTINSQLGPREVCSENPYYQRQPST
jgi:hypothetical protein